MDELAKLLCLGEFSSLTIGFNEAHACNYQNAKQWADAHTDFYELEDFPGGSADRDMALQNNTVWSAQWYPHTPVGFCSIYASSFEKLVRYMRVEAGLATPSGCGPIGETK